MRPLTALIWCVTVLVVAWLAHRGRVEITITHRLDLSPLVRAAPAAPPPKPPPPTTPGPRP